jgi:nitrous-oxide reductase
MDSKKMDTTNDTTSTRRGFLGKSAALGLAGVTLGLAGCKDEAAAGAKPGGKTAAAAAHTGGEVAPGQLDDYYAFISSGHSGEARVLGLPSGRELKRIPVFNIDCMVGWGITNESKAIMGTRPDGSLKYTTGDTHHVHGSYKKGTYDGRWLFINDKLHSAAPAWR